MIQPQQCRGIPIIKRPDSATPQPQGSRPQINPVGQTAGRNHGVPVGARPPQGFDGGKRRDKKELKAGGCHPLLIQGNLRHFRRETRPAEPARWHGHADRSSTARNQCPHRSRQSSLKQRIERAGNAHHQASRSSASGLETPGGQGAGKQNSGGNAGS